MTGNPRATRFLVTTREEVVQMEQSFHDDTLELDSYFWYEDDYDSPSSPSNDLTDLEVKDDNYDDLDFEAMLRDT